MQRWSARIRTVTRERIAFVGLVDHLTAQGVMEPGLLDASPFADGAPQGPERVFDDAETSRLFAGIETLNQSLATQVSSSNAQPSLIATLRNVLSLAFGSGPPLALASGFALHSLLGLPVCR